MTERPTTWREAILGDDATVHDAVMSLDRSSQQIVLVVDSNEALLGTITDGDIRRGLLRGAKMTDSVNEVLQRDPMVLPTGVDRPTALMLMRSNSLMQLPVVDEQQRLVGLHLWNEVGATYVRDNILVILAGGRGTRLHPHTENCPKPMLPVGDRPLLQHVLERARKDGFRRIQLAIHHLGHMIEDYFGDGRALNLEIEYLREQLPLGTAGALSLLKSQLEHPLLVANGDVLTDARYGEILDFHLRHGASATMAVRPHEWQHPFGVVYTEGVDICGFEEKPTSRTQINAGIYAIDPEALTVLQRNQHCDMPTMFERLQALGRRTVAYPMHEAWLDVGRPEDLDSARRLQSLR